jgi:hypothetical protein
MGRGGFPRVYRRGPGQTTARSGANKALDIDSRASELLCKFFGRRRRGKYGIDKHWRLPGQIFPLIVNLVQHFTALQGSTSITL